MFLLLFLFTFSVQADEGFSLTSDLKEELTWKQHASSMRYICKTEKCDIDKLVSDEKLKALDVPWEAGGTNPTSVLCKLLNGKPLIAYLKSLDELSVCSFEEKIYVHGWDLHARWKKLRR